MRYETIIAENLRPTITTDPPRDFAGGLPTFTEGQTPPPSEFMNVLERKRQRLYSASVQEALDGYWRYVDILKRLYEAYKPLLNSYDIEQLLPTTTALSYMKPHHTQLDERGYIYKQRNYTLPQELEEVLVQYYRPWIAKCLNEVSLTITLGKNPGWPTPKGGRSDEEGDMLAAIHAAVAVGAHANGWSLATLIATLEGMFGKSFTIPGFRHQMKDGWFFEKYLEGTVYFLNSMFRVRAINMNLLLSKCFNNPYVKPALHGVLASDMHTQDRTVMSNRIYSWKKKGWHYVATDFSRYDFHMGFQHGKSCLRIASRASCPNWEPMYNDLCTEFDTDNILYDRNGLYITPGGAYLSSGISTTSLVGSIGSHIITLEMVHLLTGWDYAHCQREHMRSWDAITFGDDAVFAISDTIILPQWKPFDFDKVLPEVSKVTGMTITKETSMRFLGYHYIMDDYPDAPIGYQNWRFVQQMAFPERRKVYPFTFIGYAARMTLIPERERAIAIHNANKPFFEELDLGEWMPYDKIRAKLEYFQQHPELLEKGKTELHAILQVLTKGLEANEAVDMGLIDDDLWIQLLGPASADLTDPEKYITENRPTVNKQLIDGIAKLKSGAIHQLPLVLSQMTAIYGSGYRGVGTLYF